VVRTCVTFGHNNLPVFGNAWANPPKLPTVSPATVTVWATIRALAIASPNRWAGSATVGNAEVVLRGRGVRASDRTGWEPRSLPL
jgi:hypothetical protein